jgi:hypothetical protein
MSHGKRARGTQPLALDQLLGLPTEFWFRIVLRDSYYKLVQNYSHNAIIIELIVTAASSLKQTSPAGPQTQAGPDTVAKWG